jgi:hypothetical protein
MQNISPLINFFLNEGVPFGTVVLILMLPIVATFIAFLRQIVGIKAFGVYTPLLVTFAFLATNGLKYGIAIFLAVVFVFMLMRFALPAARGHHADRRRLGNSSDADLWRKLKKNGSGRGFDFSDFDHDYSGGKVCGSAN